MLWAISYNLCNLKSVKKNTLKHSSMGIFHFSEIAQIVPNRAKRLV